MEVKHQVFVSSTYKDLVEERQQVIHALLELDCIPSGMELFPAADEDAWTLIKEVISSSDYYLLIIGGKYGSQNSEGTSFTEMEFDYAVEIGKPIICFLHHDIDLLSGTKIEKSEELQSKLAAFRNKAEQKHCKYWKNAEDLGGKVSRSLVQLKKKHPSDGWIPGKYAADDKLFRKLEELRARILELETEKLATSPEGLIDNEELAKGNETYPQTNELKNDEGELKKVTLRASWDKIFSYVGAEMMGECSERKFREKVQQTYYHSLPEGYKKHNKFNNIILYDVVFAKIKIQLQALGLITRGVKKRAVSDTETYWKLTGHGEKYLLKVSAIKTEKKV